MWILVLLVFSPTWMGASLGSLVVNQALLREHPDLVHTSWNWEGKIQATLGTLMMGYALSLPSEETGWTWPNQPGWGVPVVTATFLTAVVSGVAGYVFSNASDAPDMETLAFQATLPGLEEELFWRGLFPALVDRALERPPLGTFCGDAFTAGDLLSTLLFYGEHVAEASIQGSLSQALRETWSVLPATLLFVYVRRRSGSVIPAMVLHNLMNTLPLIGAALRW